MQGELKGTNSIVLRVGVGNILQEINLDKCKWALSPDSQYLFIGREYPASPSVSYIDVYTGDCKTLCDEFNWNRGGVESIC